MTTCTCHTLGALNGTHIAGCPALLTFVPPVYQIPDLLDLMAGMREHRIALVELPGGTKLALMPGERSDARAGAAPQPDPTPEQAKASIAAARDRLRAQAEERLLRKTAAKGVMPRPLGKLMEDVVEEAQAEERANDARTGQW